MTEQEKSLKLAELMGWPVYGYKPFVCVVTPWSAGEPINPYDPCSRQFAAILLKFPEVLRRFDHVGPYSGGTGGIQTADGDRPTQANILDEILRMKGVEI